jgi:hypothetical protein
MQMVRAADIATMEDRLSRSLMGVEADHTIRATLPTALDSAGRYVQVTLPGGFTLPALASSDILLTFGPSTGFENTATLGSSPAVNVWGFAQSGQVLTFTVPTNAAMAGMPAGSRMVLKIGTHVPGGAQRIENPASPGLYRFIVQTLTEEGVFFVQIVSNDTITVTATVPAPSSAAAPAVGGGGASALGDPGAPPPPTLTVSNIRIENIRWNGATVVWETSANANRQVEYGETISYGGLRAEGAPLTREHRMILTDLLPERTYYVRVRSQTPSEIVGTGTISFRTIAVPRAPTISNARVTSITDRAITVLFDTDVPAVGTVRLSPEMAGIGSAQTITETASTRSHAVTFTGLRAGTGYAIQITAQESAGLTSIPVALSARTMEDRTAPPNPLSVMSFGLRRSIRVQWTNPPLEAGDYLIVRASLSGPPTSRSEGRLVYTGTNTEVVDSGLLDDTVYYYTIFAVDPSGNASSGAFTSARTERGGAVPEPEPVLPVPVPAVPPVPIIPPPGPSAAERVVPDPVGVGPRPVAGGPTPTVGGAPSSAITVPGRAPGSGLTDPVSVPSAGTTAPISLPSGVGPAAGPLSVLTPLDGDVRTDGLSDSADGRTVLPFDGQVQTHVYVASGALELLPIQNTRTILPSRAMLFRISLQASGQTPTGGQLRVGESLYLLTGRASDLAWETTVVSSAEIRDTAYEVLLQYEDGSRRREVGTIRTRSLGIVREGALTQRDRTPVIQGALVEVLRANGSRWAAEPFQMQNPFTTGEDGMYGFMVPQGSYRIRVSKAGFRSVERSVEVRDQVLALSISLTKELRPLSEILSVDASLGQNAAALLNQADIATQIFRDFTQTTEVQDATKSIVAPTAAVATAAATATAVSSFSALNYLRFLFTQPLLLIRRRTRKKWGTIYNALSKQPIELAIVRLVHAGSGVVVQTRITDAQGRFSFMAPPGQYRIQVLKPNYTYPSVYLKAEKEDGDFLDLYHGENITAKEGALLTPNIPIDPVVRELPPAKIIWQGRLRRAQGLVSAVGTAVAVGAFVIAPSVLTGGLFGVQLVSYFLFRRLAMSPKPKDWGIAYDTVSKQPLERAIIRVFDKKFNKLLETQITDQKGKYGFFAGKGLYYITAEKVGYDKFISPDIDLRQAKEAIIDQKVGLSKQTKKAA